MSITRNEQIVREMTSGRGYVMTDSEGTQWTCPAMDRFESLPAREREPIQPEPFPEETLKWMTEVEAKCRAKEAEPMEKATKAGVLLGTGLGVLFNIALYFFF